MATPNEKLAASLRVLNQLQEGGCRVFKTKEISRHHRERLLRHGFLRHVMKGWWISWSPSTAAGDSTLWVASFWEFCGRYCTDRFGEEWHLSPEQSILLHAEVTSIPTQLIVYTPRGGNNTVELPFGTRIYDLAHTPMPPATDLTQRQGIRIFTPASALIKVPGSFYARFPVEAQVALASLRDPSEVLVRLLEGGHSVVAGRLAGAFRRVGRADFADEISATMRAAGFAIRETDPFEPEYAFAALRGQASPIVGRMAGLWKAMRGKVIASMPVPPGLPGDPEAYLRALENNYRNDAYHSLSIEGYRVTAGLIERVRSGGWDPARDEGDRRDRDALAARGYWQAFQAVKRMVAKVLVGESPGALARNAHREWYRELFQPLAAVGLTASASLAGYRNETVYIRGSRHVPPRPEVVREAMPALFDLLEEEEEPAVRAVLGHWMFGYLHPYPDGNGRIARFLMNGMLASGGYPWTVIRLEDRELYMSALEAASVDGDIDVFARFVADRVPT